MNLERKVSSFMTGNNFFRNAADPYTIHLTEEPYLLRKEMLKRNTDLSVQRKRDWKYPRLKFISCKNGTLKLLNIHQ